MLSETEYNVVIWVVTSIAVIATVLRLYTRAFVVKRLGWDDALILCGMVRSHIVTSLEVRDLRFLFMANYEFSDFS